jgi:hypothetical protein
LANKTCPSCGQEYQPDPVKEKEKADEALRVRQEFAKLQQSFENIDRGVRELIASREN